MKDLHLAILWHMHQPSYLDPFSGTYEMPWVLLHGIKDYYDMPALLDGHPDMRCTFNLVPSLLVQLDDYRSTSVKDLYRDLALRSPASYTPGERQFIATNFFPWPPAAIRRVSAHYADLRERFHAKLLPGGGGLAELDDQDFMDVTMWFFLAWSGRTLAARDEVRALMAKGRGYTQEDKERFFALAADFVGEVEPKYRDLAASKQIELIVSPFYHPIMPLLYSSRLGAEADPGTPLPTERFAHPVDVTYQVRKAVRYFDDKMGGRPRGMWPSEGSLCQEILPTLHEQGIRWVATDQGILGKSLGHAPSEDELLQPWTAGDVAMFFRHTELSDLIGFAYSKWSIDQAVDDFIERLRALANRASGDAPILTIALDGENAWEFYESGGYAFLDALYGRIEQEPWLVPTTFGDYLDAHGAPATIDRLRPGSWIYGTFGTWIGDPFKNRAWEFLASARRDLETYLEEHPLPEGHLPEDDPIINAMLRAEASDWWWWLGEGHSSQNDADFDRLFRKNVRYVYHLMGKDAPAFLDHPVQPVEAAEPVVQPTGYITPAITGVTDSYFEWLPAGRYELQQGFMHLSDPIMERLYFGFDREFLYLRLDMAEGSAICMNDTCEVVIHFVRPRERNLYLYLQKGEVKAHWNGDPITPDGFAAASKEVLEVRVPLTELFGHGDPLVDEPVSLYVKLLKKHLELERFPWGFDLTFVVNNKDFDVINWFV